MFIGIDCFVDEEIRLMIQNDGETGDCDYTGEQNVIGYNTDNDNREYDLGDNLSEILNVYTPESELPQEYPEKSLNTLDKVLLNDWRLFNLSQEKIIPVVKELCKNTIPEDSLIYSQRIGIENICDSTYMQKTCLTKEYNWEVFTNSIKNENRFHSNQLNLEILKELFESESLSLRIIAKTNRKVLCRARICNETALGKDNMGPPEAKKATAGRVNSIGIPCLYLTSDIDTALHEIRARDWDYVTIGYFSPIEDLKLIDLTGLDKISPFADESSFGIEWFAINMPILKQISKELAKPQRSQDSPLDYLPTQYLSDFIKSIGFDGICYNSTLKSEGINYAIFNYEKMACLRTELIQVSSLQYEYKVETISKSYFWE